MAFRLPAQTNPLRALFDLDLLAKIESREMVITPFDAAGSARRLFESDIRVQSAVYLTVDSYAMTRLIAFERNRDHYKVLWDFGKAWQVVKI